MSDYNDCRIPARVTKSQLLPIHQQTGKLNADAVGDHEPLSLLCGGFEGSPIGNNTWEGHIVFRRAQARDDDADTVIVAQLPGLAVPDEATRDDTTETD